MLWSGGLFISVPPQKTGIIFPKCGESSKENRKTQAQFACVECGFSENADLVGAIY
jgi:putative transposase